MLRRRRLLAGAAVVLVVLSIVLGVRAMTDDGAGPEGSSGRTDPPPAGAYLDAACRMPARWARFLARGWQPSDLRDWDLAVVPREGGWFGTFRSTSHSGPYDFLQRVPLVFHGTGYVTAAGDVQVDREVSLADVAPTYAHLMGFDFPQRSGRALTELFRDDTAPPKLIVTVVIDGGGWNALDRWPQAWPNLAELMRTSASVQDAVVGSSPSITPAVHTTLSTGAWARQHGVMAIAMRDDQGRYVSGFARHAYAQGASEADPTINLDTTTLADEWDRSQGNDALIAMVAPQTFHLGMVGHGSALDGGDRDIAAMLEDDRWATNPEYYDLPSYLNDESVVEGPEDDLADLDRADGEADGLWRGHEVPRLDSTPAFTAWEQRVVEALVRREGFGDDEITDLLYVNYKAPDAAGHNFNMIAPEQRDAIASVDRAIGGMVEFLDGEVGEDSYLLTITADHGQTPLDSGGWPVNQGEVRDDLRAEFGADGREILERTTTAIYLMDRAAMEDLGVSPEQVASFLTRYTIGENIPDGEGTPKGFEDRTDERVFAAVVPGRALEAVTRCTSG